MLDLVGLLVVLNKEHRIARLQVERIPRSFRDPRVNFLVDLTSQVETPCHLNSSWCSAALLLLASPLVASSF